MDEPCAAAAVPEESAQKSAQDRDDGTAERPSAEEAAGTKENGITCKDCGLTFTFMDAYETHLHQHALEEEESQLRDNASPPGHGDSEEDGGAGADGLDASGSPQTQHLELTQYPKDSVNSTRSLYTCAVCGKSYTYLVSFQKHQKIHETTPEKEKPKSLIDHNLRNYECPDCGMSFIRRTRLISHLRVHRSKERDKLLRCDQCNKVFASAKSWTAHVELHKERRFWCLSCALGFLSEPSLDKHLQSHSVRQLNHTADKQSNPVTKPTPSLPKTQQSAKARHCLRCGKRFWRSKSLYRHRRRHRCQARVPPGSNQGAGDKKAETSLTNGGETLEMDASRGELQAKEEEEQMEVGGPDAEAEDEDQEESEDSDCGEPGHRYKRSEPRPSDGQPDRPSPEAAPSPARRGTNRAEHRVHKYWEWECIECDMGFDEVAKLHLHYVKHATGELPIPKQEIEG
uniref:Uncharacterized zinc finger protein 814 n=1 Tax=Fundulus heteroclitus TaxID=8078 RepID=A0A3Q2NZV0_FUNHE